MSITSAKPDLTKPNRLDPYLLDIARKLPAMTTHIVWLYFIKSK